MITDPTEIKRKIRENCKQIYVNEFYSFYELDQFLEKHTYTEELENLYSCIMD